MPLLVAIPKKVKIKTCFIGLGLSILTTTSLFLSAPVMSEPTAAKIIVAQSPKVLRSITSPIGRVELIEVSNGYATGKIVSGS